MSSAAKAIIVNNVASSLVLVILGARILFTLVRRERIDFAFTLVVASVLVTVARIVIDAHYLRMGNISDVASGATYFDASNLSDIRIGSQLVLVSRALVTTFLWLQIAILLLFYSRITFGIAWVAYVVTITWISMIATFVATILLTFIECQPISLFWTHTSSPPPCVHAYAQFLTQTLSNIALDILLLVIAYPIIGLRKRTTGERITLYTLFTLGTFAIIITIIRLIYVCISDDSIVTRCFLASLQMLVSAFVANAPHLYGSIRVLWTTHHHHQQQRTSNTVPSLQLTPSARERRLKRFEEYNGTGGGEVNGERPGLTPLGSSYMLRPLFRAGEEYDEESNAAVSPYSRDGGSDG